MSLRLSPLSDLLPRAAKVGVIDSWYVEEPCFVIHRGSRSFFVEADELIDVLYDLTEEHASQRPVDASLCPYRPAA